ncbi:MAG: TRAP transporter TatT component family protein [Desulfobacterales bacterium]
MRIIIKNIKIVTIFVLLPVVLSGCAIFYSSATSRLAENLSYAFENQLDIEVVQNATPAYLLMMDAMIREDPDNISLLKSAATLNVAYADIFVKDTERSKILTGKALDLALKAVCLENKKLCNIRKKNYDEFKAIIDASTKADIDSLYILGAVWASWIQASSEDWNAVAELPRVEAVMQQVILLNPAYEDGGAFLYLGTLATLLPPALGGQPEKGRQYFEKAIELSGGKNLYAKVLYAQRYARMMFDQKLHDRLLNDVCSADPNVEGYALINTIAQKQAKSLLESSEDYF